MMNKTNKNKRVNKRLSIQTNVRAGWGWQEMCSAMQEYEQNAGTDSEGAGDSTQSAAQDTADFSA